MSVYPDDELARDAKLTAVYRAAWQDAPPPALDAAILAAARREVDARPRPAGFVFNRAWRSSLSVAAVVVLSVTLITLMREEAPDLVAPPNADIPATEMKSEPPVMGNDNETARERSAVHEERTPKGLGLKPSNSMPPSGLALRQPEFSERTAPASRDAVAKRAEPDANDRVGLPKRRNAVTGNFDVRSNNVAAAPEPERQPAKPDAAKAFVRAPAAAVSRAAEPAAEKALPAAGAATGKVAENEAAAKTAIPSADRADANSAERAQSKDTLARPGVDAVPAAAAKPAPPRQAVPASPAPAMGKVERNIDLAPEKWLERIEVLRKQGRFDEAKASLAEFKKRFPDYRLPDSLRDGIQ